MSKPSVRMPAPRARSEPIAKLFAFNKIAQATCDCRSHLCVHVHRGLRPTESADPVSRSAARGCVRVSGLGRHALGRGPGAEGTRGRVEKSSAGVRTLRRRNARANPAGARVQQLVRRRLQTEPKHSQKHADGASITICCDVIEASASATYNRFSSPAPPSSLASTRSGLPLSAAAITAWRRIAGASQVSPPAPQ